MSEDQIRRRGRAAAHHVLIRSADVGGDDLEDHSMLDLFPSRRIVQLRKIDRLNFNDTGLDVRDAAIAGHNRLLFRLKKKPAPARGLEVCCGTKTPAWKNVK